MLIRKCDICKAEIKPGAGIKILTFKPGQKPQTFLRKFLHRSHGTWVESDVCPDCSYMLGHIAAFVGDMETIRDWLEHDQNASPNITPETTRSQIIDYYRDIILKIHYQCEEAFRNLSAPVDIALNKEEDHA